MLSAGSLREKSVKEAASDRRSDIGWNADKKTAGGCTTGPCAVIMGQKERKLWRLPQDPEEAGYYTYGTPRNGEGSYGQAAAIELIDKAEREWASQDSRRFGVGNMSLAAGGPFEKHKSHQLGLDVDIRPVRKDGLTGPNAGVTWKDANYDREATQRLVDVLRGTGMVDSIYFNDSKIKGVTPQSGHDNHLHVRVKPDVAK